MIVFDAVLKVVESAESPLSASQIQAKIVELKLFEFRAKEPVGIVRNAIARHLRAVRDGKETAKIRLVERDRYAKP